MERAGNRRGGHGENVHCGSHLFQSLFVGDAEALFFIDDDQAEVGEVHIFGEKAVSADENVNFAFASALHDVFLLLG